MKTKIFLIALVLATVIVPKNSNAQKTELNGVNSIEVNIACQLIIVQGNTPNMEIVGDKSAIENIKTRISGNKLILSNEHDLKWQRKEDVIVKIEITDLEYLDIAGAVDMKTVRTLKLDEFVMSVSGVGNIEMALESTSFKLKGSGVTNLDITGKTNEMRMDISGVGNIRATDFIAQKAKVTNSGVGKANVHVTEKLDADVSGIGAIYYTGNPSVLASVSGLGKIGRD